MHIEHLVIKFYEYEMCYVLYCVTWVKKTITLTCFQTLLSCGLFDFEFRIIRLSQILGDDVHDRVFQ